MIPESAVQDRLWPEEQLLWIGRPRGGFHLLPGDIAKLGFMALWCGFIVFWITGAVRSGAGPFALFGVGMLAFGLAAFTKPWRDARRRSTDTLYAVTTRRVLSVSDRSPTFELPIEGLPVSVLRPGAGATVQFTAQGGLMGALAFAGFGSRRPDAGLPPAFVDVEDGAGLLRALDVARGGGGPGALPAGPYGTPGYGTPPSPIS